MGLKFRSVHSPQARYIFISINIHSMYVDLYPFKKEELNTSIDFEDNESLQIEYQYKKYDNQFLLLLQLGFEVLFPKR